MKTQTIKEHISTDRLRREITVAPKEHRYCYIDCGNGRWFNVGLHKVTNSQGAVALCQRIANWFMTVPINDSDAKLCGCRSVKAVVFFRSALLHSQWKTDYEVYSSSEKVYTANNPKTHRVYSMQLEAGAFRGTTIIVEASDVRFPIERHAWPEKFLVVNQDEDILETYTRATVQTDPDNVAYNNENASRTIIVMND